MGAMSETAAAPAEPFVVPGLTPPTQRSGAKRRIGDVIVTLGFAEREKVETVVAQGQRGVPLGQLLIDAGIVDSNQLAHALAERNGLDFVDLNIFVVDNGAANLIDAGKARRYRTIPIAFLGEGTLLVATADPANVLALDDITMATGYEVRRAVASPEDIDALIGQISRLGDCGRGGRGRARVRQRRGHRAARPGRGGAGRQARPLDHRRRRTPRRIGRPLRATRGRHARSLPRRRCGDRHHDRAAPAHGGAGLAREDHGRPRHRREAAPPGRPDRPHRGRQIRRPPRGDAAGDARRIGRHAHPRQGEGPGRPGRARHGRAGPGGLPQRDQANPRGDPRDRPHGIGQDDDALLGTHGVQHAGPSRSTRSPPR